MRHTDQISAKQGPDSIFVIEANIARSSPKPRRSGVINLMNRVDVGHTVLIVQIEPELLEPKYSCKKLIFDSRLSQILGHYSTYYLTPNNGRISNIF